MTEEQEVAGLKYPRIVCEKCNSEMRMVGMGTASGRLQYHCDTCGKEVWGKNFAALVMGSLGGKARAVALSPEKRQEIAEKAGNAFAEKMREKRRNQRLIK